MPNNNGRGPLKRGAPQSVIKFGEKVNGYRMMYLGGADNSDFTIVYDAVAGRQSGGIDYIYLFNDEAVNVIANALPLYTPGANIQESGVLFSDISDSMSDDFWVGSVSSMPYDESTAEYGITHTLASTYIMLDPDWSNDVEPTSTPRVQIAHGQSDITRHESYFKKELAPNYEDKSSEHEYVDLGLPSGTLWAKMNVGATSETDYGLYFAWGETEGYADVSTKAFSWNDYKYGTSSSNLTKYNTGDNKKVLDLEDDAAYVNWGPEWRMPTKEQCNELFNTAYVTNAWVTDYNGSGVNGRLFTSVSNGNTMFVPAAGTCQDGSVPVVGNYGCVWASSRYPRSTGAADYFKFNSNSASVSDDHYRYSGQSVRGVVNK